MADTVQQLVVPAPGPAAAAAAAALVATMTAVLRIPTVLVPRRPPRLALRPRPPRLVLVLAVRPLVDTGQPMAPTLPPHSTAVRVRPLPEATDVIRTMLAVAVQLALAGMAVPVLAEQEQALVPTGDRCRAGRVWPRPPQSRPMDSRRSSNDRLRAMIVPPLLSRRTRIARTVEVCRLADMEPRPRLAATAAQQAQEGTDSTSSRSSVHLAVKKTLLILFLFLFYFMYALF